MNSRITASLVCFASLVTVQTTASAQLGSLLREGLEAAVKGSAKAAVKGAQEGIEMAAPRVSSLLSRGIAEAAEGTVKAGATTARAATREVLKATAKHGEDICAPVVMQFGDDGARALSAVSKESGAKLAQMSSDIAKHPQAGEWISTIAKHGDAAVSWLWNRRLSIAVGTTATAILLQPESFLQAGEHVATAAITATGEHLVEPLIAETASHMVEPLMREIAKPLATKVLPVLALSLAALTAVWVGWLCCRKKSVKSV